MLQKLISRCSDFLQSREYRRVKIARFLSSLLRAFNPNIRYIGVEKDGETQFLFTGDKFITSDILAVGDFNRKGVLDAIRILEDEGFPTGKLFLDIGANIGTSTVYALRTQKFSGAICVEPSPKNIKLLKINLLANDFDGKTAVIAAALSDKNDAGTICLSEDNSGDNRVTSAKQGGSPNSEGHSGQSVVVQLMTFNSMMDMQKIQCEDISLVWIDTQGHEGFVLSGGSKVLERGVPLCMEFWPKELARVGCDQLLLENLEKHYTHFFDLSEVALQKRPLRDLRQIYAQLFDSGHHTDIVVIAKPG